MWEMDAFREEMLFPWIYFKVSEEAYYKVFSY